MEITGTFQQGTNYQYKWPSGRTETYSTWIEYVGQDQEGKHLIRIGFGSRHVYGKDRARVVVWIDGHPHAEFLGADDYDTSSEVLSEIRVDGHMCRYRQDGIPGAYAGFRTVGLPKRVNAEGVRNAWAVVARVDDHKSMVSLAALRRTERALKRAAG